jgi:hypothetical protein
VDVYHIRVAELKMALEFFSPIWPQVKKSVVINFITIRGIKIIKGA